MDAPDLTLVTAELSQFASPPGSAGDITVTVETSRGVSNARTFTYDDSGVNEVFTGTGPDFKSCALLCEIDVPLDTQFEFFAFSIESANGTVISTDLVNTEKLPPGEIPVPAAVWLFGSGLLGLVGIATRRKQV